MLLQWFWRGLEGERCAVILVVEVLLSSFVSEDSRPFLSSFVFLSPCLVVLVLHVIIYYLGEWQGSNWFRAKLSRLHVCGL